MQIKQTKYRYFAGNKGDYQVNLQIKENDNHSFLYIVITKQQTIFEQSIDQTFISEKLKISSFIRTPQELIFYLITQFHNINIDDSENIVFTIKCDQMMIRSRQFKIQMKPKPSQDLQNNNNNEIHRSTTVQDLQNSSFITLESNSNSENVLIGNESVDFSRQYSQIKDVQSKDDEINKQLKIDMKKKRKKQIRELKDTVMRIQCHFQMLAQMNKQMYNKIFQNIKQSQNSIRQQFKQLITNEKMSKKQLKVEPNVQSKNEKIVAPYQKKDEKIQENCIVQANKIENKTQKRLQNSMPQEKQIIQEKIKQQEFKKESSEIKTTELANISQKIQEKNQKVQQNIVEQQKPMKKKKIKNIVEIPKNKTQSLIDLIANNSENPHLQNFISNINKIDGITKNLIRKKENDWHNFISLEPITSPVIFRLHLRKITDKRLCFGIGTKQVFGTNFCNQSQFLNYCFFHRAHRPYDKKEQMNHPNISNGSLLNLRVGQENVEWWNGASNFYKVKIPQNMRNQPLYFILMYYFEGDQIEIQAEYSG